MEYLYVKSPTAFVKVHIFSKNNPFVIGQVFCVSKNLAACSKINKVPKTPKTTCSLEEQVVFFQSSNVFKIYNGCFQYDDGIVLGHIWNELGSSLVT